MEKGLKRTGRLKEHKGHFNRQGLAALGKGDGFRGVLFLPFRKRKKSLHLFFKCL